MAALTKAEALKQRQLMFVMKTDERFDNYCRPVSPPPTGGVGSFGGGMQTEKTKDAPAHLKQDMILVESVAKTLGWNRPAGQDNNQVFIAASMHVKANLLGYTLGGN